jgi:hypothetical protein
LGTELRLKFSAVKLLDLAADWDKLITETKHAPLNRHRLKLDAIKVLYDSQHSSLFVQQLMRYLDWVLRWSVEWQPQFKADLNKFE